MSMPSKNSPNVNTPLSSSGQENSKKNKNKKTEYNIPTPICLGIGSILVLTSFYAGHLIFKTSNTNTNIIVTRKNQDFAKCRLFARAQQQQNAELNVELKKMLN